MFVLSELSFDFGNSSNSSFAFMISFTIVEPVTLDKVESVNINLNVKSVIEIIFYRLSVTRTFFPN